MIRSGLLARYRDAGVSGVTANPAIFGIERYVKVVEAFLAGLEQHRARGGDVGRVHSVASFFVSRVDTKVDEQLTKKMDQLDSTRRPELEGLLGRAAVANSKLAYALFTQLHSGSRWDALRSAGAAGQRCLWASTPAHKPRYRDTKDVEER